MNHRLIGRVGWRIAIAGLLLPTLSACKFGTPEELVPPDPQGRPDRGQMLLFAYGCASCHKIPGIADSPGNIGPPLADWRRRKYIAGNLPNQPEELIRWIMKPQEVEPGTAMPDLSVTEPEAIDMAAYLYSQ